MAQLIQPFNANNFDPTQRVDGLPIGKHPVIIQSSDVKATKANDGGYLQLDLLIIDGPQKGTVGAYRINLYNASQQAVDIANRQMSAISHVTGVFMIQDTAQLHNIPFVVEVGPQKNDPQYTEVKKVYDIHGNEPGKAPAGGGAAQPQGGGFGQQQQPPQQQPQGGQWGGGQPQGQGAAQPPQGGGWQPPAGHGDPNAGQQQPPANGGGQWGGQPQQPPAGGGFQPPQGQQQQPPAGGGWQQGNGGAAQPPAGGGGGWQPPAGGNAGGPWGQR